ncbi:MAG: Ig-like domain-containing protein [Planctomycetota bacterium]
MGTGSAINTGDWHLFRYSDGVWEDLGSLNDKLGADGAVSVGINNFGDIAGWYYPAADNPLPGSLRSFLYVERVGFIDIGTLGGELAWAEGINKGTNALVQVVGASHTTQGHSHGFRYTYIDGVQDIQEDLGTLEDKKGKGSSSMAYGINDAGQVVGRASKRGGVRPFRYTDGEGMADLGTLGGSLHYGVAHGINNWGDVVGGSEHRAFRYVDGVGMQDLNYLIEPDPGDFFRTEQPLTVAQGINDAGQIIAEAYLEAEDLSYLLTPNPPPDAYPEVSITSPVDGATFDSGTTINFSGTASDLEDGDVTPNLVLTSSLDGEIGTGGSFSTTLSDGIHTITASATDSGGKTGSDSISITVGTPTPEVTVDTITPNTMQAGTSIAVTISGSGFVAGAEVTFENGSGPAPRASVTYVDATTIEATITAHRKAKPGVLWDVRVTNPDGSSDVLVDGFTVTP